MTPEDRESWLQERRKGIGASEVGILFGVSPYGSMLSLYADKVGAEVKMSGDPLARRVGLELEAFVLKLAAEETGFTFRPNSRSLELAPGVVRATPDAFVYDENRPDHDYGVADAKVVGQYNVGVWLDGGIPLDYQLQLQTQMLVTGCQWGILAGLLLGSQRSFVWHRIESDPELQTLIRQRIEWFWAKHVLPRFPPEADDSAATERAIAALHPGDNGMMIHLGSPLQHAKKELDNADIDLRDAQKRVALRKNQLRLAMGDATFGEFPDGTGVSLKTQRTAHGGTTRVLRTMKPKAVIVARKECDDRLERLFKA